MRVVDEGGGVTLELGLGPGWVETPCIVGQSSQPTGRGMTLSSSSIKDREKPIIGCLQHSDMGCYVVHNGRRTGIHSRVSYLPTIEATAACPMCHHE